MVSALDRYCSSSYRTLAHGKASTLTTPHSMYLELGNTPIERQAAYRALFCELLPALMVEDISKATVRGLALKTGVR